MKNGCNSKGGSRSLVYFKEIALNIVTYIWENLTHWIECGFQRPGFRVKTVKVYLIYQNILCNIFFTYNIDRQDSHNQSTDS